MKIALEFRNGSYFTGPDDEHGGPLDRAVLFETKKMAKSYFGGVHSWVWFHGGMLVGVELTRIALPEEP